MAKGRRTVLEPVVAPTGPTAVVPTAQEAVREIVSLASLHRGQLAQLVAVELQAADRNYLSALGLTVGCRFRVCHAGDPWILQARSTRIGIASAVARQLQVMLVPEAPGESRCEVPCEPLPGPPSRLPILGSGGRPEPDR